MAGADRVEGTLFGNGERAGNVDIITVVMDMFSHGVDPRLDFHDIPKIGYILEKNFGYTLPPRLREELSYRSKDVSDMGHRELTPDEINRIFHDEYVNRHDRVKLVDFHFTRSEDNLLFTASATFQRNGQTETVEGNGNGRLSAIVDAMRKVGVDVHVETYSEHALDEGSHSRAAAYVGISSPDDKGDIVWGAGEHHDIITASVRRLISAVNRQMAQHEAACAAK